MSQSASQAASRAAMVAPVVEALDVMLSHDADPALRIDALALPTGAVTAVIGPNGSGKTSFLRAICGLLPVASGTLRVFGEAPGSHPERVAHVLQANVINTAVPITVREVVRMGRYVHRSRWQRLTAADHAAVEAAMERLALTELARAHPAELSGGQRQRVHLAQGLAQGADLLLLDEPVTGLDLPSLDIVAETIRDEREAGRSVVLTTHDVGTAQRADHVVLVAGRVVASGAPSEVLTSAHLQDAYGGHLHALEEGALVLDDPHHHRHGHQH